MVPPVVLAVSDWSESYVLEWVGLVLVALVFWRYLRPPLSRAMNAQADRIRTALEAGKEAALEAEKVVEAARAALADAQREAAALAEQSEHAAERLAEEGRRRAEEDHARVVARAETEIALERSRMGEEIERELSDLVVRYAGRIVEAELDEATQHRLFAEVIDAAEAGAS